MSRKNLTKKDAPVSVRVKAAMILRQTSLLEWAKAHDFKPQTVYAAVNYERRGKKSMEVLRLLKLEGFYS